MDNLARNAMLARQDGMSYGQWKALHPNTMGERIPDERECVCQFCGKTFVKKTKQIRKYCDWFCANQAGNARQKELKEKKNGKSENVRDV